MSEKEKVKATIDIGEPSNVSWYVKEHPEVSEYGFDTLRTGDLQVGSIVVERKTLSDYAGSLQDGRLTEQVGDLADLPVPAYLLIADDLDSPLQTEMPLKSIRGSMASIMARKDVPVIPCSNDEMLVDLAVRLARKTVEEPGHRPVRTGRADRGDPVPVQIYACVPGVGRDTAEQIAEEYPTLSDLRSSTRAGFMAVSGVGEETANAIEKHLL